MNVPVKWFDDPDSTSHLMWGHIKAGEVSRSGSNGTWYAYYRSTDRSGHFNSLGDFSTKAAAQQAVEKTLADLAARAHGQQPDFNRRD